MPSTAVRENIIAKARRVVVKIGTNAITGEDGRLDKRVVAQLASQVAAAIRQGRHMTLVVSGAIGAGISELDLPGRPTQVAMLQATAAVGQGQLMRAFHDAMAEHGVKVAQVLVTRDAFEDRRRYLNIRNTLAALEKLGAVAIINENDAVAVDEIRFGDNDIIAALVANMLRAELLVLLSSVDGVLKEGSAVDAIEKVDDQAMSLATAARSRLGSGGMGSKMQAAAMVTRAGDVAVIANSRTPEVLTRLLAGQRIGTVFVPAKRRLSSRSRWIAQAARAAGKIVVDDGAAKAITQRGKSLLPSGIVGVVGRFARGSTVAVLDPQGRQIARGLSNYSSEQIDRIKGLRSDHALRMLGDKAAQEVIHRNNMTVG